MERAAWAHMASPSRQVTAAPMVPMTIRIPRIHLVIRWVMERRLVLVLVVVVLVLLRLLLLVVVVMGLSCEGVSSCWLVFVSLRKAVAGCRRCHTLFGLLVVVVVL